MIYIHIGPAKTGSTSLQAFLRLNREALAKLGFCFPDIKGVRSNGNATPAALSLTDEIPRWVYTLNPKSYDSASMFDQFWGELVAARTEPSQTIIVSSEEFEMVSPKLFLKLSQLEREPKKIILFLRRQDRIIESVYAQLVWYGYVSESLTSFVNNILNKKNPLSRTYAYHDFITRWSEAFGKDNIIPILFKRKSNDFIFHDFMDAMGIELNDDFRLPSPQNETSAHPLTLMYLRLFNRSRLESMMNLRNAEKHRKLVRAVSSSLNLRKRRTLLPMHLRMSIMAAYSEQNKKVAQEFFPTENPSLFELESLANLSDY